MVTVKDGTAPALLTRFKASWFNLHAILQNAVCADVTKSSILCIFAQRDHASTHSLMHAYTHARTHIPDCVCNRFLASVARSTVIREDTHGITQCCEDFRETKQRRSKFTPAKHLYAKTISSRARIAIIDTSMKATPMYA
jgi:hypothetical protein